MVCLPGLCSWESQPTGTGITVFKSAGLARKVGDCMYWAMRLVKLSKQVKCMSKQDYTGPVQPIGFSKNSRVGVQ